MADAMNAEKYAVHTVGPDDVEMFDNGLDALRWANEINCESLKANAGRWDDGSFVLCFATVTKLGDNQP